MKISYYSLVLIFSVTLWGCSNGNSSAPAVINQATGKHTSGWALNGTGGAHTLAYFSNPSGCQECHGADLKGGISQISCSNPGRSGVACHAEFPPNHGPDFVNFTQHGAAAKATPSDFSGMGHCRLCHGAVYTGNPPAPSCVACHKLANTSNNAPHAANWVSGNVNGLKHSTTAPGNAPACYQCHAGGKFSHPAPAPAPAGTAPGCFNGTMCHNNAGHAFNVTDHYLPAASNLASCQTCHATPASGSNPRFTVAKNATLSPNGCENCHNRPGLAHPYIWLPGRGGSPTYSHASAQDIVASCGMCHGGAALTGGSVVYPPIGAEPAGIAPPACFSTPVQGVGGTACHFTKPINAGGTTVGCVSCHASPPNSASATAGPNRNFRHNTHFVSIPNLTCPTCHFNQGTGTTIHSTKLVFGAVTAPTAIQQSPTAPAFNEGGAASYSSSTGRCANISCHGSANGFVLPNLGWKQAGTMPVDCTSNCHNVSTTTQAAYGGVPYIGPFSGNNMVPNPGITGSNLHEEHVFAFGYTCDVCHIVTGVHYSQIMLGRRTLASGFAAGTVKGSFINVAGGGYTYVSPTSSSCVNNCHSTRSWYK